MPSSLIGSMRYRRCANARGPGNSVFRVAPFLFCAYIAPVVLARTSLVGWQVIAMDECTARERDTHRPRIAHPSFNGGGRPCFVFEPKNAERALSLSANDPEKQQNAQNFSRRLDQTIGLNEAAILVRVARPKDNDKGSKRTIRQAPPAPTSSRGLIVMGEGISIRQCDSEAANHPQRSGFPVVDGTDRDRLHRRTNAVQRIGGVRVASDGDRRAAVGEYAQRIVVCRQVGRDGSRETFGRS